MQRRMDGSESFNRNWTEYKNGFGNPSADFWIGNDNLYQMTSTSRYKLVVVMENYNETLVCAAYDSFRIGSPDNNYTLYVANYSGNAGDSLILTHNGMPFSTFDNNHDNFNCAVFYRGGWWFHACFSCFLNGLYSYNATRRTYENWWGTFSKTFALKFIEMRVELLEENNF
ncbi:hypothetical protein HELRODRAFT_95790 [Helobdella robusta]|uniref:Fibrinogen C-terminal domain-containing protein n=1 Tax=Helobdella robusta TaxID=6412 RepID=T1G976_HELRO|nr:hypothetical protein HELRODRAFT_95790 [Helobdella robusta]ESN94639.1 hypothetical protein HELRODRAFT_95790 [Helobdella robusta]